jgi:hypothetical protein
VLENPFVSDEFGANGVTNKILGVVGDQGSKFFSHGVAPIRINDGNANGGGHRRQGRCRSGRLVRPSPAATIDIAVVPVAPTQPEGDESHATGRAGTRMVSS